MAFTTHHTDFARPIRSFIRPLVRLTARMQIRWRQHQTEKMLESLPSEIRKDIGWPATDNTDAAQRLLH